MVLSEFAALCVQRSKACGISLRTIARWDVTGDNIMNGLCYIGCVVANPFKVLDAKQDLSAGEDIMRVLAHMDQCLVK